MLVSKKFLIIFVILFTAYAHISLTNNNRNKSEQRHETNATVGRDIQNMNDMFNQITLVESNGIFFNINADQGKKILLFSALRECKQECLAALKALTLIKAKTPGEKGLLPLFITSDPLQDDTESLQNFINTHLQKHDVKMLTGDSKGVAEILRELQNTAQRRICRKHESDSTNSGDASPIAIYLLDSDNTFVDCISIQCPNNPDETIAAVTGFIQPYYDN